MPGPFRDQSGASASAEDSLWPGHEIASAPLGPRNDRIDCLSVLTVLA